MVGEVLEGGVVGTFWERFGFIVGGYNCCESWGVVLFKNPFDDVLEFAFFAGLFVCFNCAVDVATHFCLVFSVAKLAASACGGGDVR